MSEKSQVATAASVVLEERNGAILTLRMNRPERLNALNVELGRALAAALKRAAADASIRVIVITGAGRAFCAGGDLAALRGARERNAPHELKELLYAGKEIVLEIARMQKPVVAAVNGPAAGGGMNLALSCDMRIASDQAVFAESFANLSLYPDFGGTYYLPRLVGISRAVELFWTAEIINATHAEKIGIVNHVVPAAAFEDEIRRFVERLAAAPPLAVGAAKHSLFGSNLDELERVLDEEIAHQVRCFNSEDALEGFKAFFEKRKPVFQGR